MNDQNKLRVQLKSETSTGFAPACHALHTPQSIKLLYGKLQIPERLMEKSPSDLRIVGHDTLRRPHAARIVFRVVTQKE